MTTPVKRGACCRGVAELNVRRARGQREVTLPEAGVRLLPLTVKLVAVPAVPAVDVGTVTELVLTVSGGVAAPVRSSEPASRWAPLGRVSPSISTLTVDVVASSRAGEPALMCRSVALTNSGSALTLAASMAPYCVRQAVGVVAHNGCSRGFNGKHCAVAEEVDVAVSNGGEFRNRWRGRRCAREVINRETRCG